jgi:hypothetical protein
MPDELTVPYCRYFRQKAMYVRGQGETLAPVDTRSQGHCWCLRTLSQGGPDGQMVEPPSCIAGRTCYESY